MNLTEKEMMFSRMQNVRSLSAPVPNKLCFLDGTRKLVTAEVCWLQTKNTHALFEFWWIILLCLYSQSWKSNLQLQENNMTA